MDYNRYTFQLKERIGLLLEIILVTTVVSFLFYESFPALILGFPIGFFWKKRKQKKLADERKMRLKLQFKDGILAVSNALQVGYSIENAFLEGEKDLRMTYPPDADIIKEFHHINSQVKNNRVLENLIMDFAVRTHIKDIKDFAQVFVIAKRKGGDLAGIIQNTVDIISEKIEVQQEIETILTAKQFEQRIMSVVPVMIMFYIRVTSPHFFDSLYHNLFGIGLMTLCLVLYGAAIYVGERIVTIEI
ncbi:MAG: hypothetical protein E7294_12365 [Lachnospiraceae bacterium]|nr:hypothetical protein [Lachnospiraceae bacterium]